ncbi:MAG: helix-turn-helix domain-containing protein, partial [Pseudomonadota bacterium]
MEKAISISSEYTAEEVRGFAKSSTDVTQCRRLLAIAAIRDGASRSEAAKVGGVQLQTLRDWVMRFNKHGPDSLQDRKAPGASPKLGTDHQAALVQLLEDGPDLDKHGVVRWHLQDLVA